MRLYSDRYSYNADAIYDVPPRVTNKDYGKGSGTMGAMTVQALAQQAEAASVISDVRKLEGIFPQLEKAVVAALTELQARMPDEERKQNQ